MTGAMGRLQGLGPQLRDAGRSAWEPRQAWALPTPQQQRVRRGHPGEGRRASGSGPGCGHLPPPPASCGRGPDLAPQPAGPALGTRPPSRPYRGGGHGGSGGHPVPAGGGNREKEGPGWKGGPCGARNRLPRAAAPPGHYNNGGPVQPRAPGMASRSPSLRRRGRQTASASRRAGRCGFRGGHTPKPTCINTLATPSLTPRRRVVTGDRNDTDRRERIVESLIDAIRVLLRVKETAPANFKCGPDSLL